MIKKNNNKARRHRLFFICPCLSTQQSLTWMEELEQICLFFFSLELNDWCLAWSQEFVGGHSVKFTKVAVIAYTCVQWACLLRASVKKDVGLGWCPRGKGLLWHPLLKSRIRKHFENRQQGLRVKQLSIESVMETFL